MKLRLWVRVIISSAIDDMVDSLPSLFNSRNAAKVSAQIFGSSDYSATYPHLAVDSTD
jgi:hypothetical protein